MIGIYKIQNQINGKVYIGKSVSIESRWKEHQAVYNKPGRNYDFIIYRAMRKYGLENFSFEIIETFDKVDKEVMNNREIYWISYYNSYHNGYNMTLGGEGRATLEFDLEDFVKIYNQTKSLAKTASILGCGIDTVRERLKLASVKTLSYGNTLEQGSRILRRAIQQYSKSGEVLRRFQTITEAANFIIQENLTCGTQHSVEGAINKCACGKTKTSYGFIWKYIENDDEDCEKSTEKPSREILKNQIRALSFCEVGRKYAVSDNTIRKWCKGFGLPFKKSEIVNYTDEDWSNV